MIQAVVNHHLPDHWEKISYTGRYKFIDVLPSDASYSSVTKPFTEMDRQISSVRRLQNPYLYGRFKLCREKKAVTNPSCVERTMYHAISQGDMETVAEYNCDYRRYKTSGHSQNIGKNPVFYSTPETAKSHFRNAVSMCIVVLRVITSDNYSSSVVTNRDNECYPEYFVLLE